MNRILKILLLCILCSPFSIFAKSIDLYEEPQDKAKVVGTLDSDIGIIPIFTPEKGDWMKVADPRNGNVGWVKIKNLGSANTTEYTFTQRFINTGNSPQSYQIFQFGGPKKMTPDEVKIQLKKTEQQQQLMQENMNKAMQNMMKEMNNFYHWNIPGMNPGMPFVMPVIVIPAANLPAASPSTAPKEKTTKEKNP